MKVTHVTTRVLRTPADNPLVVGLPEPTDTREFVTLELGTDQGLVGLGLTFFGGALTPALKAAVDAFANLIVGDDPTQTEAVVAKIRRAAGSSGPGGIFALALSAVDIACWDLKGKAAGKSVCALLGDLRDRVPTYASGALMLKRAAVESTAEAYLELLAARGVEYLFANAGTDFAPLIEAYAKRGAQGQTAPRPLTVPHETPAVAMALNLPKGGRGA